MALLFVTRADYQHQAGILPAALPNDLAVTLALGEPVALSRFLSAWLQTFDHQSGISIAWQSLDYDRLIAWLELQLLLDPTNPFPPLAASHLYGGVSDQQKSRQMIEFIVRLFRQDPERHWRWMATAALTSKHRLNDLPWAEQLAAELDQRTKGILIPAWARQMHILLKAELGEKELAASLLLALIKSGDIKDKQELRFLTQKLEEIRVIKESSPKK